MCAYFIYSENRVIVAFYENLVMMVMMVMMPGRGYNIHVAILLVAMFAFCFKFKRYVPDAVFF